MLALVSTGRRGWGRKRQEGRQPLPRRDPLAGTSPLLMASKPAAGRSPGEKRKRVVLTLKEKMDICRRLEKGESRRALMQEYNVGMSTLYDIRAGQGAGAAPHPAHAQARAPGPRAVRVVPGEAV